MALLQGKETSQILSIGSKVIGKIITTEFGFIYTDIALNPFVRNQRVFLFIDDKGNIEPVFEGHRFKNKYIIKSEIEGLPPSRILWPFNVFIEAPRIELKKAYEIAKDTLESTVVFRNSKQYDLVVAWCMYTWLRGLFPKNINLYFFGFPATGKSQALKYCKNFARYVVDYDPTAEKSYKWNVSHTLGVISIDEAEYISRIQASKLRKYHETGVLETRTIGLPLIGLTPVDLRVDAPIVMAATHPPADTAFLQRGFIIRMFKGSPEIKDFNMIPDLEERKYLFAKSVLSNWMTIFKSMNEVYMKLLPLNIDERVKDLVLPIATILNVVGKDWNWLIDYARFSFSQSNFVTPETTAFILMLQEAKETAAKYFNKYIIPISRVSSIIDKVAAMMNANKTKLQYLRQYMFAGCEVSMYNGELCYICDMKTVDSVLNSVVFDVLSDEYFNIHRYLQQAPKYLKEIVFSSIRYIELNNIDMNNPVLKVDLKDLKKNMFFKQERRRSIKHWIRLLRGAMKKYKKILDELGYSFNIIDDKNVEVIIDLTKFKKVIDILG